MAAKLGGQRAYILDLSLSGFRVAHQHVVTAGSGTVVELEWEGERAAIDCRVIRSHSHRGSQAATPVYHSGLEMVSAPPPVIRRLIEWHVSRALDEQKANARGIPAVAAQSFQTGGGTSYVRHELVGTGWRSIPTTDPKQPPMGFTVSASTSAEEVTMLQQTFEQGDRSARQMLQKMAEISISSAAGIPTRKYTP